jgi:hypothetical protein
MPDPDYFDRLLARHAGVGDGDVARVRPRLPGPFERAAPRWVEAEEPMRHAAHEPAAPPPSPLPQPGETRVEHHTETRTERTLLSRQEWITAEPPGPLVQPEPDSPPIVAQVAPPSPPPAARPASPDRTREPAALTIQREKGDKGEKHQTTEQATAVRRAAALPITPRRRPKPAEPPAVHVRIGRLEVRADRPAPPKRTATPRPGRPAPAVSLTDYLRGAP